MRQAPQSDRLHAIARTTDVEIDLVVTPFVANPHRSRQLIRLAATELQRDRVLHGIVVEQSMPVALEHGLRGHHLRVQANLRRQQAKEVAAMTVGPVHHRGDRDLRSQGGHGYFTPAAVSSIRNPHDLAQRALVVHALGQRPFGNRDLAMRARAAANDLFQMRDLGLAIERRRILLDDGLDLVDQPVERHELALGQVQETFVRAVAHSRASDSPATASGCRYASADS